MSNSSTAADNIELHQGYADHSAVNTYSFHSKLLSSSAEGQRPCSVSEIATATPSPPLHLITKPATRLSCTVSASASAARSRCCTLRRDCRKELVPRRNGCARVRERRLRRARADVDAQLARVHWARERRVFAADYDDGAARVRDEPSLVVAQDELAEEDQRLGTRC